MAHDLFFAPEGGDGVEFLVTKATGKLQFPVTIWSVDEVEQKSKALLEVKGKLEDLRKRLSYADLIKVLMDRQDQQARDEVHARSPISGLFALASSDQAPHQTPSNPNSPPEETIDAKAP